jgi:selenocysteine lyase/cysteine desulfurase
MMSSEGLTCRRIDFALERNVTYLNCAYQSPLSKRVSEAGRKGLAVKSNPHLVSSADFFEPLEILKKNFAQLIGLKDPQRLAVHPSASYGFAIVAKNLPVKKNGTIIMPASQFPSNYYAFADFAQQHNVKINLIDAPQGFNGRTEKWNGRLLEAISDDTICVTADHTHWQDGTVFDLNALREKCNQHQALLIVDGTQSVGAFPMDIEQIKPDAMICAGYKFLMGPLGSAISYFGEYFDTGRPIEFNWINRLKSDDFASLSIYEDRYRPKAYRYNVGEFADYIHMAMLKEALQQIMEWQVDRIQAYCHQITRQFIKIAQEKGYGIDADNQARHLFGIYCPEKTDIKLLVTRLHEHRIFVSVRGQAIRISPHVYNDESDLMRLATQL